MQIDRNVGIVVEIDKLFELKADAKAARLEAEERLCNEKQQRLCRLLRKRAPTRKR